MCYKKKNKTMTLCKFYKGLNDDFRKEIRLIYAFIIDQTYNVMQDYELLIKSQRTKHQDLRIIFF